MEEAKAMEYNLNAQEGKGLGISSEEAIYRSVVDCVRDNDMGVLELKMRKLKSILGYKDSAQLLEECERKAQAVKRRMGWKKAGKVISWLLDAILVALLVFIIVWVIRHGGYHG